ncbi:chemotaxis protein CheB [Sphingomonas sp. ABOLD]|uniref:CheR family methyltransferase n=1 Tax=Sphingomonas sp. ABOLD TaxID=1985877 RepID=UPI001F498CCD|nr:chemotaxis protein CheB [Sphingomonas sp. ABOLD]
MNAPFDAKTTTLPIVGIGASAGGLEALREMLAPARAPTGMAFVIVQHLDPNHESMLAQLLDRQTSLEVLQCEGGEQIEADKVYIIPPGHGLAIRGGKLELTDFAQPRGLRRPIDDFFLSLAADQQGNAACVILSGTGADGTIGLRAVKEHGGVCLVQEPESARYDGMPLSAVGTGLVDFVKAPGQMLDCLHAFFHRSGGEEQKEEASLVADHVDELCKVLRTAVGHDFSGYKRTTLVRRIERRMHVLGITSGRAYLARAKSDADECEALFRDLLINVTRFFRDADLFDRLRTQVIEPLMRSWTSDEDIRVWIPGCSSGEEAYSIAMLFAEAARKLALPSTGVQIFATDIDEQMLQIARNGVYPASALVDLPPPLRERYTLPHAERFQIVPQIRDMIRFSNHSLVKDPPFSRIDLVSCRNLLIYFDDRLQQSVMPLLHYAIRPEGYLFLGPSETIGRFEHLFPAIDGQARIFQRSPGAPNYPIDLPGSSRARSPREDRHERQSGRVGAEETAAVRRLIDRYAPASLVLDQEGVIIAAYGRLGRYFDFPVTRTGGSSAIGLARPGLRNVLGPLLRAGRDKRKRVVTRDVTVESEYGSQTIDVVCDPMPDGTLLFVFRETAPFRPALDEDAAELDAGDDHLDALEDELRVTRHRLRTTVEELETANEELKSSNEEMMSMNEELQSTNEELSTVNDELKGKVDQLTVANSDLRNFFESTDLAVVVLDAELRIRSFTEAATALFPLQPSDRGRPLADVASRLSGSDYLADARAVIAGEGPRQRRVTTQDGSRTLSMRTLPYRAQNGTTDGATLVLTDITDALSLERALAAERERLDMAIRAGGIAVWEYRVDTGETVVDDHARDVLGIPAGMALNDPKARLERMHPEDRPRFEAELARVIAQGGDLEISYRILDGEEVRRIKTFGRRVDDAGPRRLVGVSIDITPEYKLAETRELMLREMNHRVKNLFAIVSGMISVGARSHDDVTRFANDMRERIAALGRAHSLAAPAGAPPSIDLAELVEATLAPYRDHASIEINGPAVKIHRTCLSPLALMLHEWATNAVKYGALGAKGGELAVRWERVPDGVRLDWRETGDRPVSVESSTGFGTILVQTSSRQLGVTVTRSAEDHVFAIQIHLPAKVLANDEDGDAHRG